MCQSGQRILTLSLVKSVCVPSSYEAARPAWTVPRKEERKRGDSVSQIAPGKDESLPRVQYPRFAAFYEWFTRLRPVRSMTDPLRRETAGKAYGLVLEVGAGTGLNFPLYQPGQVERVEAVEPDAAMLRYASRRLATARVPIMLTQALVEALPFADPVRGLREIKRVLKPGGTLLLLEHVRAQGALAARVQDVLVPLTTRLFGNCHWNRDTARIVHDAGFQIVRLRQQGGGLQPVNVVQATAP